MKHLILLLSVYRAVVGSSSSPVVKVEHGELVGTTYRLPNGEVVYSFLGIPYAAPPIQKHRFKVSLKHFCIDFFNFISYFVIMIP